MKRLLLLVFIFSGLDAAAQQVSHALLKLRLSDGAPLSVNIDGQFINRNTSILKLDGIEPGQHKIEVYKNRKNDRRPKRIFTATIPLEAGTVYIGLVDLYTQRLRMKTRAYDPSRDGASAIAGSSDPQTALAADDTAGADGYGSFPNGRNNATGKPDFSKNAVPKGILPETRMTILAKQVTAKKTDGERLTVLKQNLMNAKVSVAQLDQMLEWLSFESTRLELTDWISSRTADPEHLDQLDYRFSLEDNKAAFRKQLQARQ
jgi:hypothetical protein